MKKYLIRYSAEIGTKSASIRWKFIHILADNIKSALKSLSGDSGHFELDITWDFILLETNIITDNLLDKVPGIQNFSLMEEFDFGEYSQMIDTAAGFFADKVKGKQFAVRCKKTKSTGLRSMEVEKDVGAKLVEHGKVNLTDPEVTCFVEVREDKVYLYDNKSKGCKGLPLRASGKALVLYSGGIDSPVAVWRSFRIGIDLDFLYYDLGGKEQMEMAIRSARYLKENFGHGSKGRFFLIDFKPVIAEILKAPQSFHNLLLKYCFYKTAERLASDLGTSTIVTGEAIGQVSTQTMQNLEALNKVTDLMIIRPLVSFSKNEVVDIATDIGTYDLAYKGKEYCALATKNVVTAASYEKLDRIAGELDLTVLDEVFSQKTEIDLGKKSEAAVENIKVEIPDDAEIIDLRDPDQFNKDKLDNSVNIPFNDAWSDYIHWDKNKKYFLVCDVGSASAILAEYMKRDDFDVAHLEGGLKAYSTA